MKTRRTLLVATLAVLVLAGCGTAANDDDDRLLIVATTSIWGDVLGNIVEEDADVEVLIPAGADAHDYEATSAQIATLVKADLVIANGLGLEETMEDTLDAAVADGANLYEVAPDLNPLEFSEIGHGDESGGDDDGQGRHDPHVWFDPLRMASAAELIADRLVEIDDSVDWKQRASDYGAELMSADEEIAQIVAAISDDQRKLVTNHEALGYFADRYGFELIGVVIPGGSTLADPSSADLASLVNEIEHEGVSTIFAETTQPTRLADAVAAEVGREVSVVLLYTESLGEPGSGADDLAGMLLTDARLIAEALTGAG